MARASESGPNRYTYRLLVREYKQRSRNMVTAQADTLRSDIVSSLDREHKSRVKRDEGDVKGMALLEELVLPHMPRSLSEYFTPNYISFILSDTLRIDFVPKEEDYPADLALGTLRKVESGLIKGGWTITDGLTPSVYGSLLVVRLSGFRSMEGPAHSPLTKVFDKMMGREIPKPEPYNLYVNLAFERLKNTEHCQIVEREVEVEAVAAHMETKKVLVCDEDGWDKDGQST